MQIHTYIDKNIFYLFPHIRKTKERTEKMDVAITQLNYARINMEEGY